MNPSAATNPQRGSKRPRDPSAEPPNPSTSISEAAVQKEDSELFQEDPRASAATNPGMQRYFVAVEYVGTKFSGSQKQPNFRTVVGALEEAFHKFVGQPVSIYCSSRTDAGVHALSNVCHVDVERVSKRKPGEVLPPHEPGVVRRAVNHFLQKNEGDIMVIDVRCVPSDFHARFKALERTYYYRLLSGPEPLSTFDRERAWHVPEKLDIQAMKDACNILVGCHDFSSFRAAGCQANSPIKTLDELHVAEVAPSLYFPSSSERREVTSQDGLCSNHLEFESSGAASLKRCSAEIGQEFGQRARHHCYVITARARSFLYHQFALHNTQSTPMTGIVAAKVRLLVGVLKCVGTGELTTSDVERILHTRSVTAASPMAPACGLYLGKVKYELP